MSTNEPNDTSAAKHLNDVTEPASEPATTGEISAAAEPAEQTAEASPLKARFVVNSGASTHPTG